MKKLFKTKLNILWAVLFAISFISIVLMISSTYSTDDFGKGLITWKEYLKFWFHFTFISNLIVVITSFIVIYNKVDFQSTWLQRLKILMIVNITLTGLVYWILLSNRVCTMNSFQLITTIFAHALVPALSIFVFTYESLTTTIEKQNKIKKTNITLLNLLFPLVWIIIAIIIYYSLGGNLSAALYNFLDYNAHWTKSLLISFGITIIYPLMTLTAVWIYTK